MVGGRWGVGGSGGGGMVVLGVWGWCGGIMVRVGVVVLWGDYVCLRVCVCVCGGGGGGAPSPYPDL